jgi:hypothetical protein
VSSVSDVYTRSSIERGFGGHHGARIALQEWLGLVKSALRRFARHMRHTIGPIELRPLKQLQTETIRIGALWRLSCGRKDDSVGSVWLV